MWFYYIRYKNYELSIKVTWLGERYRLTVFLSVRGYRLSVYNLLQYGLYV